MRGRAMDGEMVSRWQKERWDPGRPQRSDTVFLQQGAVVANNYELPGRNVQGSTDHSRRMEISCPLHSRYAQVDLCGY